MDETKPRSWSAPLLDGFAKGLCGSDWERITIMDGGEYGDPIIHVNLQAKATQEEQIANARLIVQAPAMCELLRQWKVRASTDPGLRDLAIQTGQLIARVDGKEEEDGSIRG